MVKGRQYGSMVIKRGICQGCGEEAFICIDGTSSCCDAKIEPFHNGKIKRHQ